MKQIFEEVKLNNLILKNRLVRSATWEGIAKPDGGIEDNAYQIYNELSKGGVGLIITGFVSVSDSDRYFGGMMRLSNDELIIPLFFLAKKLLHDFKTFCNFIYIFA